MTILATSAIYAALRDGAIVCDPPPKRIEGAHIDVRIGAHWWLWQPPYGISSTHAVLIDEADPRDVFVPGHENGRVVFPSQSFVLAHTLEYIGTAPGSGLLAMLDTRSTMARWGLAVHQGAGVGDEGFCSRWTLEVANPHRTALALPVGARVGCVTFHRLEGSATPYAPGTRYNAKAGEWTPQDMLPKKGNW